MNFLTKTAAMCSLQLLPPTWNMEAASAHLFISLFIQWFATEILLKGTPTLTKN
jgi:hypothetical protein